MPPDISRWAAGNTGVPYVWTFDSGKPGPHCAIVALTHGNEYCGAIAIDALLRDNPSPLRGRLSFVFANVEAFESFSTSAPFDSRCLDDDFNRLWSAATLDGSRTTRELTRARALRPVIDSVDHLLDLHSMHECSAPLLLCGTSKKGQALAKAIGCPRHVLIDAGHAAGTRLFDYAAFADDASPKTAYLVECGQHWERSAADVAKQSCARFLAHFGMITGVTVGAGDQRMIAVSAAITVHSAAGFRWAQAWHSLQVVPNAGTVLGFDGEDSIKTPYDECVLIMPTREPHVGNTAVRLGRLVV
jgi:predicted deacylase